MVARSVPQARPSTRRTGGMRTAGRSARVVEEVLRHTAEELSRVGYAALRVEDVAERSGVNKTTIYRRWPTKADLVRAALRQAKASPAVDTGALESDVLTWLGHIRRFATSSLGSGLIRVIQTERGNPELEPIARVLRDEQRKLRLAMIERAIRRGELPRGTRAELVADLVFSPVIVRLVSYGETVTDEHLRRSLQIVVSGMQATSATPGPAPKRVPKRALPSGARTTRAPSKRAR